MQISGEVITRILTVDVRSDQMIKDFFFQIIKRTHIAFLLEKKKKKERERERRGDVLWPAVKRKIFLCNYLISITKSPRNNHAGADDCTLESITASQSTVKSQYPTRS